VTLAPEALVEVARRRGPRPPSPYVGLVPFGEADERFFFGRFREIAVVSANLRSSRLTLLYGPSGVGKSSLLQAGVVPALRRDAQRPTADRPFTICSFGSWLDDPARGLEQAAREALEGLAGGRLPEPAATLAGSLRTWTGAAGGTLLVVLDQFEEYFQYHPGEDAGEELTGFAGELARIVDDPALPVHVLISIREDAWSKLDRFEGHVPSLFVNYLRVDHLDLAAARDAIEGPVGAWNRTLLPGEEPYYVEGALVQALLATTAGSALAAAAGEPEGVAAGPGARIEAPFLQLVLERLWEETVADGSHTMELAVLEELGGARRIVENHLLEALDLLGTREQDIASECFRFLVTTSKTKLAQPAADLAEWTRRPERKVTAVLEKLCSSEGGRVLRAVAPGGEGTSYELFHDVLADPVLAWRRRHEAERRRREFRRRLARFGAVAVALCAAFGALAAFAWIEYGHARLLLHEQRDSNHKLETRIRVRTRQQNAAARSARVEAVAVRRLRVVNAGLRDQAAAARTARDTLLDQIHGLRVDNHALAVQIGRLNTENAALATQITGLDRAYASQSNELDSLDTLHGVLVDAAAAVAAQTVSLAAQRKALAAENADLVRKAAALGLHAAVPVATAPSSQTGAATPRPTTALRYTVPGDVAGSDALRREVESLTHRLAVLIQQRAKLADEAGWYRKANALLVQQRDALRREAVELDTERAKLASRNAALRGSRDAAAAEHARLAAQRASSATRNAKQATTIAARRKANGVLQDRANNQGAALAGTQAEIARLTTSNTSLAGSIESGLAKALRGARSTATDPRLAGLLAVSAYRLAPYDPDDPAHPSVYNALWLALDHLDAPAAAKLVAPTAQAAGKVGTTTSAKLAKAICARTSGTISRGDWGTYFPAGAPYAVASASPCG
jgi:hypothetical protein